MLLQLLLVVLPGVVLGKLIPLEEGNCDEDGNYHFGAHIIDHYFADRHYVNVIVTNFDSAMLAEKFICEVQNHPINVISIERYLRLVHAVFCRIFDSVTFLDIYLILMAIAHHYSNDESIAEFYLCRSWMLFLQFLRFQVFFYGV